MRFTASHTERIYIYIYIYIYICICILKTSYINAYIHNRHVYANMKRIGRNAIYSSLYLEKKFNLCVGMICIGVCLMVKGCLCLSENQVSVCWRKEEDQMTVQKECVCLSQRIRLNPGVARKLEYVPSLINAIYEQLFFSSSTLFNFSSSVLRSNSFNSLPCKVLKRILEFCVQF